MTLSMSDPLQAWLDERSRASGFADPSDYVHDLIRRDRERSDVALSIEEIRELVSDAKAGGFSDKSVDEIFEEAKRLHARPAR